MKMSKPIAMVMLSGGAMLLAKITARCSVDPEPTPYATPTSTVAPTATSTPIPVTAAGQPTPAMRGFVIDWSTAVNELVDRLSEREAACIRAAVGDSAYEAMLGFPLLVGGWWGPATLIPGSDYLGDSASKWT